MELVFQPHDLLWVTELDDQNSLPEWFDPQDLQLRPVVVRRESTPENSIAIGIRGLNRSQRHASYVKPESVFRVLTPEQIVHHNGWLKRREIHPLPHWKILSKVNEIMKKANLQWGITGSLGFELATGIETANEQSDIDLYIISQRPLKKLHCMDIALQFDQLDLRPDVQIETPYGAFAMSEWLVRKGSVMVKSKHGPYLTTTPWQSNF